MTLEAARLSAVSLTNWHETGDKRMNDTGDTTGGDPGAQAAGQDRGGSPEQDQNRGVCADFPLVLRVRRGDKKAFDLLVLKYQARIMGLISRFLKEPQDVSDVAQEAFIKAYRSLHLFRGDAAFYTWLYRIAVNCAKNHLAQSGRQPVSSRLSCDIDDVSTIDPADEASPEDKLCEAQLSEVLQLTLRQLPEELRAALMLREFDGLSYEQIADVLSCPVGTVRSRIFRGREQLMAAVTRFGRGGGAHRSNAS